MTDPIRHAYDLTTGRPPPSEAALEAVLRDDRPGWVHLDASASGADAWIDAALPYLPQSVREALTQAGTRPRTMRIGDGVLLILRGLNTNPEQEPEDMVSLRLWVDARRVVSLSLRELATVQDLARAIEAGQGPRSPGGLLLFVTEALSAKLSDYLDRLDEEGDLLERRVLDDPDSGLRGRMSDMRGEVVDLRQFIAPQREALARLAALDLPFLDADQRLRLGEVQDQGHRMLEVAESLRERLAVLRDELAAAQEERSNRNLYRLSMISAIFLPLGTLTGLMGVNLAGMPGASWPPAFWVFTGGLTGLTVVLLALLRWLRWL